MLITCPECGAEVSAAAPNCPKCGYPLKKDLNNAPAAEVVTKEEAPKAAPQPEAKNEPTPAMPESPLTKAILATIFCCWPLGIVAIVKASQITSLYHSGAYAEAVKAAEDANKWIKYSLFGGIAYAIFMIIYMVAMVALGVFAEEF